MVGLIGHPAKPPMEYARIISSLTGKVIGGRAIELHLDGEVVILFAGMRKKGKPLYQDDILAIEAGTYDPAK